MKVDRINAEINKIQEKISEQQTRLADLRRQKTEAENTEIVATIRSANISQQELIDFIHAFKTQGSAAEKMLYTAPEQEDYDNDEA